MSRRRSFDPASEQTVVKAKKQSEEQVKAVLSESPRIEGYVEVDWVADLLKVKIAWVYAHARGDRQPRLRSHKFGRYVRFLPSEVMEFGAEHARNGV